MKTKIAIITLTMLLAALTEYAMGRRIWGVSGKPGFWSGDIWSSSNSQFVLDPYTFTHISHGILFFALLALVCPSWPVSSRLALAVGLESGWEVLENTNMMIERYRTETISLNYYGDSIVNSVSDIFACILGFIIASRLPKRATLVGTIALEIVLALWIRDNLTLNIVMLLHPNAAIRTWQLVK